MSATDRSFITVSPGVHYSDGAFLAVTRRDVDFLKSAAMADPHKRARLCFHSNPEDTQQEMLIVAHQDSYVCPHQHATKIETLSLVEGCCDALLFDANGHLLQMVFMTTLTRGGAFFYRMPSRQYHSLLFRSEWVVFVETTIGPFTLDSNESAQWAPPGYDSKAGLAFLAAKSASLPC